MRNRALPAGESRLIQPGQNGLEEVVYRVTREDGKEVRRKEVQRRVIRQAMDEIMMVSSAGQAASVPITGTVAYISSGNAWVMRNNSGAARPLTTSGDLDQRVFSLSPDGEPAAVQPRRGRRPADAAEHGVGDLDDGRGREPRFPRRSKGPSTRSGCRTAIRSSTRRPSASRARRAGRRATTCGSSR